LLKDHIGGSSFLYHNAAMDGAVSGRATANVRLNRAFSGIRSFRASMMLVPGTEAGILIQDKYVTYYFYARKNERSDSIAVYRHFGLSIQEVACAPAHLSDTVFMEVDAEPDSIRFKAGNNAVSFANIPEFSMLQWVGFECPKGCVKIFCAAVCSAGGNLCKPFDEAGLINLHLDKMVHPAPVSQGAR